MEVRRNWEEAKGWLVWSREGWYEDKITGEWWSAHCGARAATTDATTDALELEWAAYVSNQLRNLSGRLSTGVHALRAGSYWPRNFLFRSASALAKFDSQLAEHVAD